MSAPCVDEPTSWIALQGVGRVASTGNCCNFSNAVIDGTNFSKTDLTAEQLYATASYKVKNLRGIGLSDMDLSTWDFSGQDLSNAELVRANLTDANLENTNLMGADLRNVVGFSPVASTNLRNAVVGGGNNYYPGHAGYISGLDVRSGERFSLPHPVNSGYVAVRDGFSVSEGGILEMHLWCGFGCQSNLIDVDEDIPVELQGTLRLVDITDGPGPGLGTPLEPGFGPTLFNWGVQSIPRVHSHPSNCLLAIGIYLSSTRPAG